MLDLWVLVHEELSHRPGSVNLLWTKAHPTQSQIENLGLRPGELYLMRLLILMLALRIVVMALVVMMSLLMVLLPMMLVMVM